MINKIDEAWIIAKTYDVLTPKDGAVVYSVSFMPTDENKQKAIEFIRTHPNTLMLDDTPCGKALIALGLNGKVNEVGEAITKIWHIASERYIKSASGNIHAFVDGADERSTFCTTELAEIMKNPRITHINGIEKIAFTQNFKPQKY